MDRGRSLVGYVQRVADSDMTEVLSTHAHTLHDRCEYIPSQGFCPFLLLENSRPLSPPWGPWTSYQPTLDFLSTLSKGIGQASTLPWAATYCHNTNFVRLQKSKPDYSRGKQNTPEF